MNNKLFQGIPSEIIKHFEINENKNKICPNILNTAETILKVYIFKQVYEKRKHF